MSDIGDFSDFSSGKESSDSELETIPEPKIKHMNFLDETVDRIKNVNIVEKGINVKRVTSNKNGAVFIECKNKTDVDKLKLAVTEKVGKAEIKEIRKFIPRMVIFGISNDMKEDDILDCLFKQNEIITANYKDIKDLEKEIKIKRIFKSKENKFSRHVVVEVTGKLRIIIKDGLNIGWNRCKVEDDRSILHCFKCLRIGHKSDNCKDVQFCNNCGGQHDVRKCISKEKKCIACIRNRISGDIKHSCFSKECLSLKKFFIEFNKKIDYE
nr:uncharacterized protein LOC111419026 [Onthophagus taurus]